MDKQNVYFRGKPLSALTLTELEAAEVFYLEAIAEHCDKLETSNSATDARVIHNAMRRDEDTLFEIQSTIDEHKKRLAIVTTSLDAVSV